MFDHFTLPKSHRVPVAISSPKMALVNGADTTAGCQHQISLLQKSSDCHKTIETHGFDTKEEKSVHLVSDHRHYLPHLSRQYSNCYLIHSGTGRNKLLSLD